MTDKSTCWYEDKCCDEMNRFFDVHVKDKEPFPHIEILWKYLNELSPEMKGKKVLDLGCGTAMNSQQCLDYEYYGADLPHIIEKCAMRNYPEYFYRSCDVIEDSLKWIKEFPIIIMSGFIDIMEKPVDILCKILENSSDYVILHRQEITMKGQTRVIKNPSYSGFTYHSIINMNDFKMILDKYHYNIHRVDSCGFSNWEGFGTSFLLKKRKTYALNQIDYKLNEFFLGVRDGFFVDIGANDGRRQSNTFYFEHFKNWSGILVEPIHEIALQCEKNRSVSSKVFEFALTSPENAGKPIKMIYTPDCNGLMSIIKNDDSDELLKRDPKGEKIEVEVNAVTLDFLLNACMLKDKKINLLKIDVEGHELEVLKGFSPAKWNIDYILIEELKKNDNVLNMLSDYYERLVYLTEQDVLYKRKS